MDTQVCVDIHNSFRSGIKITHLNINLESLPESFKNYKIASLTDYHFGCYTNPRVIEKAFELVNDYNPNLIFSLGDYIHSGRQEFKLFLAKIFGIRSTKYREYRRFALQHAKGISSLLNKLNPEDGILSVWGNHDYIEGNWILRSALPKHITHLNNQSKEIIIDPSDPKAKIIVYGIDDFRYGKPDLGFIKNSKNSEFPVKILLSHNPDFVLLPDAHCINNFSIILSGHTHGGQVCLPGGIPIKTETWQRRYYSGFYNFRDSGFYISNGIGCSGLPLRLNCPPELVFIEFKSK